MNAGRLRTGEWYAAVGAVLLALALFVLHWYGLSLRPILYLGAPQHLRAGVVEVDGWHAVPTLRWFALVTVVLGLGLALAQAASRGPALPVTLDLVAMPIAGLTTLLVVIRLASTGAPLRFGAIVGLLGAGLVAFGAFRALRTEGGADPADPAHPVELVELVPRSAG